MNSSLPPTRGEGEVPSEVKLTKAQRDLLDIAARDFRPEDGWQPRFDRAHSKWIPDLLALRRAGLLAFTHSAPLIRITPAGRAALLAEDTSPSTLVGGSEQKDTPNA